VYYASAYIKFKNNEIVDGPVVWKASEKPWKEMQYKNGKLFGEYREYYEKSGDLKVVKNYGENGRQEGLKKYYYEGMVDMIKKEVVMADGKAVSYKEYYENGKLMEEGGYDSNSFKNGMSKIYSSDGEEGQLLYKSGKKIAMGTKEAPIDPQAYNKIDEILNAVKDSGFQYELEQGNVALGGNAIAGIKGKEFSMNIRYISDKEGQKEAEEQVKTSGALASMFALSGKSKGSLLNYFKDRIIITVFAESNDIGKKIEDILKKTVPGLKRK